VVAFGRDERSRQERFVNDDRDDDAMIARAYDAASKQLDERPDARIRANVLAVAARAVHAKPRDAATPRPINPFVARRWPVSLAAVLVVSLMSGLIATRVMRDDPDRITTPTASNDAKGSSPVAPAAPQAAEKVAPETTDGEPSQVAKPSVAPQVTHAKTASRASKPTIDRHEQADRPASTRSSTSGAMPAPSISTSRPDADDRNAARPVERDENTAPPSPKSTPPSSFASTPAPAPPAPSTVQPRTMLAPAAPSAAAPARHSAPVDAARERDQDSTHDDRRKTGTPSVNATTYRRSGAPEPATPEAWVERIVKLREGGRSDEADAEVEALRSRYPGFDIPMSALGKPGAR
jgi:hypothetical protein